MLIRRVIVALAASAVLAAAPQASAQSDQDRLGKILRDKYRPAVRTQTTPPASDLYIVDPDGKVRQIAPAPPPKDTTGKQGTRTAPTSGGLALAASGIGSIAPASSPGTAHGTPPGAAGRVILASDGQMVVNRRIVVIQLKPSASESQIDALVRKYSLNVIDAVPSLGALYVALDEPSGGGRADVRSLLEPALVVKLRQEPIVNAAFVQTTIAPRTLPPPTGASVQQGSQVLRWHWRTDLADDGNWGLKVMRMPSVWTVLARNRAVRGAEVRPATVAVLDHGFGRHVQLSYRNLKEPPPTLASTADCARSHGTHVAGIIAAQPAPGNGIDGIVPQALLHAVPISRNLMLEGTLEGFDRPQVHLSYFADVIRDLGEYFDEHPLAPEERRVVNVSLAYNWAWVRQIINADPTTDQSVRNQIQQHANFIQYLVDRVSGQVLFVAAAGNDSEGAQPPLSAKLATPFAYAALHETANFKPSRNIIVVEAHDRNLRRAAFSNGGGHVSAPGVAIMSTFASDATPYGTCSGTSQAAPHVAALAAILFQLDRTKTPEQMIKLIVASAQPIADANAAPRADALAAVFQLSPGNLRLLADLNSDGSVDAQDLERFRRDLLLVEGGRFGGAIPVDLNHDGVVDANERCWPRIDLNGSGRASHDPTDVRPIGGAVRSDLDVLRMAWTDQTQTFDAALKQSGLSELVEVWQAAALTAAMPGTQEGMPCQ